MQCWEENTQSLPLYERFPSTPWRQHRTATQSEVRSEVHGSGSRLSPPEGAQPGAGSIQTSHSAPLLVPWAESVRTDQGRWRPLTIPGPKLPNSDGRISCSDGWARRQIGRDPRPGKLRAVPGRGGRKSGSPKEPCLWPPAPPGTGRRWQRCSGREQTSTTPT